MENVLEERPHVLAGPSGVGKSSLINVLFPKADMEIGEISEKIKRGKHTTRHSELFSLGDGSILWIHQDLHLWDFLRWRRKN